MSGACDSLHVVETPRTHTTPRLSLSITRRAPVSPVSASSIPMISRISPVVPPPSRHNQLVRSFAGISSKPWSGHRQSCSSSVWRGEATSIPAWGESVSPCVNSVGNATRHRSCILPHLWTSSSGQVAAVTPPSTLVAVTSGVQVPSQLDTSSIRSPVKARNSSRTIGHSSGFVKMVFNESVGPMRSLPVRPVEAGRRKCSGRRRLRAPLPGIGLVSTAPAVRLEGARSVVRSDTSNFFVRSVTSCKQIPYETSMHNSESPGCKRRHMQICFDPFSHRSGAQPLDVDR